MFPRDPYMVNKDEYIIVVTKGFHFLSSHILFI